MPLLQSGRIINGYEIKSFIAEGASSEVYSVVIRTQYGGKPIIWDVEKVLKLLKQDADSECLDMFVNEAETLQKLKHSRIPRIIEHFTIDFGDWQSYALVTAKAPGMGLEEILQNYSSIIDEQKAVDIILQLCEILGACHASGVVHRDLKPAQVKLTQDGAVYLMDFGNAKDSSNQGTICLEPLGTPGYCCLEQYMHQPATPAFDVYGLGAVFYELLTKEKPVDAMDRVKSNNKFPKNNKISRHLQPVLDKMLALHEKGRYHSTDEVVKALQNSGISFFERTKQAISGAYEKFCKTITPLRVAAQIHTSILAAQPSPSSPQRYASIVNRAVANHTTQSSASQSSASQPALPVKDAILDYIQKMYAASDVPDKAQSSFNSIDNIILHKDYTIKNITDQLMMTVAWREEPIKSGKLEEYIISNINEICYEKKHYKIHNFRP